MEKWKVKLLIFFVLIIGSEARRMTVGRASSARISSRVSSRISSRSSSSSSRSGSSSGRSSSYRNSGSSYSNSQSGRLPTGYASRYQNEGYQNQRSYSGNSGYLKQQWGHQSVPFEGLYQNPALSQQYRRGQFSNQQFPKSLPKSSGVKMLGLGAGAGLLAGAASGVAGYHVLQKYQQYNMMRNGQMMDMDQAEQNCQGECPAGSTCVFDICDCLSGFTKNHGLCSKAGSSSVSSPVSELHSNCSEHEDCQEVDINLVCNNTTMNSSDGGVCACRENMEWSTQDKECQLVIGVDCASLTQNIAPSPAILEALNKMLAKTSPEDAKNNTEETGKQLDHANNLMSLIDPKMLSEDDLKEAFCRDIDPNGFNLDRLRFDNNIENDDDDDDEKPKKRITVSVALIIISVVILHIILILCIVLGIKKVCYCCRKSRKIFKKILYKKTKPNVPEPIQFSTVLRAELEEDARLNGEQNITAETNGNYETKQNNGSLNTVSQ